jgi:hypothetical protein
MTTTRRRHKSRVGNYDAVQSKADRCFDMYLTMTPPRSLSLLQKELTEAGLSVSLSSLKAYSSRFNWQDRVKTARDQVKINEAERNAKTLSSMDENHARIGRTLQRFGAQEITHLLNAAPGTNKVSASDVVKLFNSGINIERLASGLATERTEITIKAINLIVAQVVDVFADVAKTYSIPAGAVSAFAAGAEKIASAAFTQSVTEVEFER